MSLVIDTPIPLQADSDGVIRVGGTRVTLDTIVSAFQRGETPEVIADQYPAVALADIYFALGFYLRYREEVDSYLAERQRHREAVRREWEARCPQQGIRERLLARRPQ